MLLLDGQVHHDTHVIPVGNYMIGVGNYVTATPSELGNYMSADNRARIAQFRQEGHDLAELCGIYRQVKIAVRPGLVTQERIYRPAAADTCPQPACSENGQQIGGCFGVHDVNARTMGRAASRRPSDP